MSSGTLAKLVYMANQIAIAFKGQKGEEAAQATYDHIWHFWDPRMRAMISDHLGAGGEGLNEVALEAITLLVRSAAEPRSVTRGTEFSEERDPDPMSDAG